MAKRFIWNFEFHATTSLNIPPPEASETYHWERRFFWDDQSIITLAKLDGDLLDLAQYKVKSSCDTYYLLPNANYNVKKRKTKFSYKPVIKQTTSAVAYGNKLKLDDLAPNTPLPGTENLHAGELLAEIHQHGKQFVVNKERLIHRFPDEFQLKLEFAKLQINGKTYFSLCLESPSITTIDAVSKQLRITHNSCDYITFLKEHIKP